MTAKRFFLLAILIALTGSFSIMAQDPPDCPCNIWTSSTIPGNPSEADTRAIEAGVKFRSNTDGYITGVRFYKGDGNTGTHTGNLWTSTGINLARATFMNETATGWQEVSFGSPVAITAGTTYVASYHTTTGHYSEDNNYFTTAFSSYYLEALQDGTDGPNGVYTLSAATTFPTSGYIGSNYWVDVVFVLDVGPDVTPPVVNSVTPPENASGVAISTNPLAVFNEFLDPSSVSSGTVLMTGPGATPVAGTVSLNGSQVTFTPSSQLDYSTTYTIILSGGAAGIQDLAGNDLAADYTWSFTTIAEPPPPPTEGPGGPILVISSATNPFSRYPVEILRAEGLNQFYAMDVSQVTPAVMDEYDVILLGEFALTNQFVTDLTTWVTAGGTLIAFRPDAQLSSLLGLTPVGGTLSDGYLLVNTATDQGAGIVDETIQFHSAADLYTLNGATSLATLYSTATAATINPAVTEMLVGGNGGKAYAFTYDLARSVVYTHQGNPAWAGQKRDGKIPPIRSDDMFVPSLDLSEPGWIDLDKVHIPQADEQQKLLANIIIKGAMHRKVMPRFWFLPKGLKAAVVMTGDNHSDTGMEPRFDRDIVMSPAGCSVDDWECVRSTGYFYVGTTYTNADAIYYESLGFESAVHINTNCADFTPAQFESFVATQLTAFANTFPDIPLPSTNRNHCIAWSDWSTVAEVSFAHGIRLDANYYYWPNDWHQNRVGMFTGSGNPMRFAKLDGTMIDVYQVVTQMQDEGHYPPVTPYPAFCDALLDNAIGPEGYYGVFCANMHFDTHDHPGANAITASAQARGIPVVSARQMLEWLDGRNGSSFGEITWTDNTTMTFSVTVGEGARNLMGMLPVQSGSGELLTLTNGGSPVTFTPETIKGISYAFFPATEGDYVAIYGLDEVAPVITDVQAIPNANGTAVITWMTDEASDSRVDYGLVSGDLTLHVSGTAMVTSHTVTLTGLVPSSAYYYRVTSTDDSGNSASMPVSPSEYNFTTPAGVCAQDLTMADFSQGTPDANTMITLDGDGAIILKPGYVEDFAGATLPSGWVSGIYSGGTTPSYSDGQVIVDGSYVSSDPVLPFVSGASLEFTATFTTGNYQYVGFASNAASAAPWAVIGRGTQADNSVYARVSTGGAPTEILLGSDLSGTPHNYRIKWNAGNFEFYVDGILIVPVNATISTNMVIVVSDFVAGAGTGLSVDWLRTTPYSTPGSFTSRVFDGVLPRLWGEAFWTADVPDGTSLAIYARGGESPVPDGTWTDFVQIAGSGSVAGVVSRYIQYRADLSTSNNLFTPVLRDISFSCSDGGASAPEVTIHPLSQTGCEGSNVTLSSVAVGSPAPTVQWEVSPDGVEWSDVSGAIAGTLSLTINIADDGNQYRAVWSNTEGAAISSVAVLTVNAIPGGSISPLRASIFPGEDYNLVFNATAGTGPFDLEINETTYPDIESGIPFSAGTATYEPVSIWNDTFAGGTQTVDATPTELGLSFSSSVAGTITGIRFYKHGTEALTFTVSLWAFGNQTALATADYTSDNTAGWKQINFATPVPVSANTTYIASYHTLDSYYYAFTSGYLFPRVSSSLTAFSGYYNPLPGYPGTQYNANYWVDVDFSPGTSGTSNFSLTSVTSADGCILVGNPISSAVINVYEAQVWTGNASSDWNNPDNWSTGVVPDAETAVVPVVATSYPEISGAVTVDALAINASASLAINSGGALTVSGDLNNSGILTISSTLESSGSLIVNGVSTGSITYNRQLKAGSVAGSDWHLAAAPVDGNSEANTGKISGVYQWSEVSGAWTAASITSALPGHAYNIRQEEGSDGVISFTGPIVTTDVSVEVTSPYADAVSPGDSYFDRTFAAGRSLTNLGGKGWNLLGNPYPSAISVDDFIAVNYDLTPSFSQFDPNYVALYLFDGTARRYYYLASSTGWPSGLELNETHVQAGQGFFVLAMNDNSEFQFTRAMQEHSTGTAMLKSGGSDNRWPGLQLKVKNGSGEVFTTVVYNENMSSGVDPGYDIGLFRSGQEIELYTTLAAKDNGINYTRQAVPSGGADTLRIPVGIDFKAGGEVVFSASTVSVGGRRFWLEDRTTGIFTDLSLKSYTVTLPAATYGTGRFFLLASANMPAGNRELIPVEEAGLRIWAYDRKIIIKGEVTEGAVCEIFDMGGRKLLVKRLTGGELNTVDLPEGIHGVVVVRINDLQVEISRKVALPW